MQGREEIDNWFHIFFLCPATDRHRHSLRSELFKLLGLHKDTAPPWPGVLHGPIPTTSLEGRSLMKGILAGGLPIAYEEHICKRMEKRSLEKASQASLLVTSSFAKLWKEKVDEAKCMDQGYEEYANIHREQTNFELLEDAMEEGMRSDQEALHRLWTNDDIGFDSEQEDSEEDLAERTPSSCRPRNHNPLVCPIVGISSHCDPLLNETNPTLDFVCNLPYDPHWYVLSKKRRHGCEHDGRACCKRCRKNRTRSINKEKWSHTKLDLEKQREAVTSGSRKRIRGANGCPHDRHRKCDECRKSHLKEVRLARKLFLSPPSTQTPPPHTNKGRPANRKRYRFMISKTTPSRQVKKPRLATHESNARKKTKSIRTKKKRKTTNGTDLVSKEKG